MKYTVISALIVGIVQVNVYATISHQSNSPLLTVRDGLVLDNSAAINWTEDANLVSTLCHSNHPLWKSFNPASVHNNSGRDADEICAQNGRMNWYEAQAWVSHLNNHSYLHHNDWRLPNVDLHDPSCSVQLGQDHSRLSVSFGQHCSNGELARLRQLAFNNEGSSHYFNNLDGNVYWSNTELSFNNSLAGTFDLQADWQDAEGKTSDLLQVWAVHSQAN